MADKKTSGTKSTTTKVVKAQKAVVEKKAVKSDKAPKTSVKIIEKKTEKKMSSGTTVTLKQIRSGAGHSQSQIGTLVGLGLNKLNKVATLKDTPSMRGMMLKVKHLIKIINENK